MSTALFPSLSSLALIAPAETRTVSPENITGEKGKAGMATEGTGANAARELGRGWKISPSLKIAAGETLTLADVAGPGTIQQIWMTVTGKWRNSILRVYWDDQPNPAVECPVGDFFASAWSSPKDFAQVTSLAVCVNPGSAFNCYWPMPFRKRCRITLENRSDDEMRIYYQVNLAMAEVPESAGYFHAHFRRVNPQPYGKVYTVLDKATGPGQYVGTYMAWGLNNSGWWGEGEMKFYLDGDWPDGADVAEHGGDAYPTVCSTGLEDYFCGSYNFENQRDKQYETYNTPYAGVPHVTKPDGLYASQTRFSMYRWHIADPIRFKKDCKVTVQAIGWREGGRYLPLQDDIASVAYWYQQPPIEGLPALGSKNDLEII